MNVFFSWKDKLHYIFITAQSPWEVLCWNLTQSAKQSGPNLMMKVWRTTKRRAEGECQLGLYNCFCCLYICTEMWICLTLKYAPLCCSSPPLGDLPVSICLVSRALERWEVIVVQQTYSPKTLSQPQQMLSFSFLNFLAQLIMLYPHTGRPWMDINSSVIEGILCIFLKILPKKGCSILGNLPRKKIRYDCTTD